PKKKVADAFGSDPLPKTVKPVARKWAMETAEGNPREFANRYEYAKARFLKIRDAAMEGLEGQPKLDKGAAATKAGAQSTPDALADALKADLETVKSLGPGQDVGAAAAGMAPEDVGKAVQKLDRIGYESD